MEIWHYWSVVGILLLILEIFVPGFFVASLGVGALASAAAAALGLGSALQVLVFTVTTFTFLFAVRPFFVRRLRRFEDPRKTGVENLLGRECLVTQTVSALPNPGRVQIGGESWLALTEEAGEIEAGETAVIERIEGATAYVTRASAGAPTMKEGT